jgi:hypothetical protein
LEKGDGEKEKEKEREERERVRKEKNKKKTPIHHPISRRIPPTQILQPPPSSFAIFHSPTSPTNTLLPISFITPLGSSSSFPMGPTARERG